MQQSEAPFRQDQGERVLPYGGGVEVFVISTFQCGRVGKDGMAMLRIIMTLIILESSSVADISDEHTSLGKRFIVC